MAKIIYRMKYNGKEYLGNVDELSVIVGFSKSYFRSVANGDSRFPDGVEIEKIEQEKNINSISYALQAKIASEWDDVVAAFREVEWVRSGGRKLTINNRRK